MDNYITTIQNAIDSGVTFAEILRLEVQRLINLLLECELTDFLNYNKYDTKGYNSGNSRNGYYSRTLKSTFGELVISVPRDRNGTFCNRILTPYNRSFGDLESTIIYLYKHGTTTREIAELIEKLYGCYYSPQTISNMTKIVQQEVEAFHNRPLEHRYLAIYCDATYLPVRRGTVSKEALHVLLGITTDGRKEVLDYTLAAHENTDTYIELLQSIKRRGVKEVFMFVTDGFCWLDSIFREIFPKAKHQYCWVHICRNVRSYVRQIDWMTIKEELKEIYGAEDRKSASKRLVEFLDKWYSKYPKLADKLYDITDFFQYMLLPQPVRKHFYTNNALEGLNNLLKRYTRKKEMFPDENSMERFVCSIFLDYNNKNFFKTATGFEEASIEIDQLFNDLNCGKLNLEEDDYT